jgi:hypothetical protein
MPPVTAGNFAWKSRARKEDSDFDPIRNEPAFEELVGG